METEADWERRKNNIAADRRKGAQWSNKEWAGKHGREDL